MFSLCINVRASVENMGGAVVVFFFSGGGGASETPGFGQKRQSVGE